VRSWGAAVLALIAALTAWELLHEEPTRLHSTGSSKRTADYFMEDFTSTVMDQEGLPLYRLTGTYMVHYPDNDTVDITAPHVVFYQQAAARWDVVAERGLTNSRGDEIYLLGKVVIHQLGANSKNSRMKILTRDVRVEPAEKYAETHQPATLLDSLGKTDAVGARVYLKEGRVELLSQVRGDYEPAHRP
jgi:lipopolysaccharide export system protein LptC